jgi:hypothetical protein
MVDPAYPARLRVEGADILKPNGQRWCGRGVNFGAWGEDEALDLDAVAAMGANVVRIPLRVWGLYGDPSIDSRDDRGFSFLKRENVVHWLELILNAASRGLWVIAALDSNCGQSGTQSPEMVAHCDPYGKWGALGGRNFFTDRAMREWFAIVWRTLARLLRPISHIAMLEILPEPLDGRGPEWAPKVAAFYRQLIDAVREVDADTPVLIGARNAYDCAYVSEVHLSGVGGLVYTGNLLSAKVTAPERFDAALGSLAAFREELGAPVFVQQLGRKSGADPALEHMAHALDEMHRADVGYTWWQWKQNTANSLEYALHYKDGRGGWVAKDDEIACLTNYWTTT